MGRSSRSDRSARSTAAPTPAPSAAFIPNWIAAAILVVLTIAVYGNTLGNSLVFDDVGFLEGNDALRRPWDLAAIFGGQYHLFDLPTGLYRPLAVWSMTLDTWINLRLGMAPAAPAIFHLTNLLFHAAVAVALYFWLVTLAWPARWSLLAAALFVVHPIHSEAVNAIVGRAELLAALFGVLMLIWHRQQRHVALCALAYLLAMWSKESGATFLAVLVLADVAFNSNTNARWPIGRYVAYLATFAFWLTLRAVNLSGQVSAVAFLDNPLVDAPMLSRWLTAAFAQLEYLRRLILPVALSSDYSYDQVPVLSSLFDVRIVLALVVLTMALVLAWCTRRAHPVVWFAIASYAAFFATTSNVIFPVGTIMGDRLAYSPSIAICLLAGYGAWQVSRRGSPALGTAIVASLSLVFALLTVERNRAWSDELTFYTAQVASAPRSAKAHFGLGAALSRVSRDDAAAVLEYERAIAIYPAYPDAYLNLGNALRRLGAEPARVIAAYQGALGVDPSYAPALENLARYLMLQGRDADAQPLLARLQRLNPSAVRTTP